MSEHLEKQAKALVDDHLEDTQLAGAKRSSKLEAIQRQAMLWVPKASRLRLGG